MSNWKPPTGFEPIFNYPDGVTPKIREGVARLKIGSGKGRLDSLNFYVGDNGNEAPTLPLRFYGELWHTGWDIPTIWAIDADGMAYMDNGHGHALQSVTAHTLIAACEEDEEKRRMQKRLGLPVDLPEWQRLAIANGWTPPK